MVRIQLSHTHVYKAVNGTLAQSSHSTKESAFIIAIITFSRWRCLLICEWIQRWDGKSMLELPAMPRYWVLGAPRSWSRDIFIFWARTCGWHSCPGRRRDDCKLDEAGRDGVASTQLRTEFSA